VIIVDSGKQVEHLGAFRLPVEVVQFAWRPLAERIARLSGTPHLRTGDDKRPYVTDEGNYILDCEFGVIDDPPELAALLDAMPGVMEHGLFVNLASTLIVGHEAEVRVVQR
jgi:ribose 5-phosphate isomerase A